MKEPRNSGKKARRMASEEAESSTRLQRRNIEPLSPKNEAQGQLISQIATKDITFSVGPAGTGKTYIAASMAAEALFEKRVNKIILTRPMIGCDEEMGFLPGDQFEKYQPWVAPMIDVLEERLGVGFVGYHLKNHQIDTRPLMAMRGDSFKNSFIILDEAQNTTPGQMKMFLSRIGVNCTMVVSGDLAQSDLKDRYGAPILNGLDDALRRLKDVPEIGRAEFTYEDVVRHGLVAKIMKCYEEPWT